MIGRTNVDLRRRVLIVDTDLERPATAGGRATREISDELRQRDVEVVGAASFTDGVAVAGSDAAIHCVFVNWTSDGAAPDDATALSVMQALRKTNERVPVFLMAEQRDRHRITLEAMQLADEFVWKLEDTSDFIAGRAIAAIDRYLTTAVPPFMAAILNYNRDHEYSWAAPGHQGGVAFPSPPSVARSSTSTAKTCFARTLASSAPRSARCSATPDPIGESETIAARVFGAHRSYSVLNGTSGSNRVDHVRVRGRRRDRAVRPQLPQVDRAGPGADRRHPGLPEPTRNRFGIIGPIPRAARARGDREGIADNPLAEAAARKRPVYTVLTNCTYDGMCYNAVEAQGLLAKSVDRIHFDEAWYAYARFNPMYRDRYAMRGSPATIRPTARRCSRRIRRTSCSPHCRRRPSSTSATARRHRPWPLQRSLLLAGEHVTAVRADRVE